MNALGIRASRIRGALEVAHEIGHFLLRSKIHSAGGLMRAQQTGTDVMSPDHRGFVLTDEVGRLRANLRAAKG